MEYPCKKCAERTVGCHSTCEKYTAAKEERDATMELAKAEQRVAVDISEMNAASRRRNRYKRLDRKW